jgi:hypothetical protein
MHVLMNSRVTLQREGSEPAGATISFTISDIAADVPVVGEEMSGHQL